MFDTTTQILLAVCFAVVLMTVLWFVQRRTGNAGIVDVAWAGTIGILGVFFAATSEGDPLRRALAGTMIGLWSLRLTVYLFRRVVGHPEEGRYVTLRRKWGERADARLFRFFQTQAAVAVVFALPVLVASHNAAPLSAVAGWLSLSIWCVGMLGLAVADRQLARFKADRGNRGTTCRGGCGGTRATRITSSSGFIGGPTCRWHGRFVRLGCPGGSHATAVLRSVRHRYPAHRSPIAGQPGRGLPSLPANHQSFHPVVPEKGARPH